MIYLISEILNILQLLQHTYINYTYIKLVYKIKNVQCVKHFNLNFLILLKQTLLSYITIFGVIFLTVFKTHDKHY